MRFIKHAWYWLICSIVLFTSATTALAANQFNKGVAYYKNGDYARARRCFQWVIRKKPNYWPYHYELANTYMKMNQSALALTEYSLTLKYGPDPKTANLCRQLVAYLTHRLSKKAHVPDTKSGTHVQVRKPESSKSEEFKHRIYIVKPRFNHQAVRQETINLVTRVVDNLPHNVYEALDKGGATVNISPNMVDKWPDSLKNMDAAGLKLAQDHARCYSGGHVYIYERPLVAGTTNLGPPFGEVGIRNVLYHELGHALDWSTGRFSITPEVLKIHTADVQSMSPELKKELWYFSSIGEKGCGEAVAETFAGLMGANGTYTSRVIRGFPRLRLWLKDKFKL